MPYVQIAVPGDEHDNEWVSYLEEILGLSDSYCIPATVGWLLNVRSMPYKGDLIQLDGIQLEVLLVVHNCQNKEPKKDDPIATLWVTRPDDNKFGPLQWGEHIRRH